MNKNLIALVIIIAASIVVSHPLLKPGLFMMHDDQQVARLFVFDQALKAGQFPVRWVGGLGFGFGYPLFIFYPPLVYVVGEIFHLIGFGYINSTKLVFFTGILFSGVAMYVLVKDLWGKYAALIGALFYIIVPYRALDVYVRGALAESYAFVWLPLVLWSLYKLSVTKNVNYAYFSAVFLALLMVTHNLIFLPFMLIFSMFCIFLINNSPNQVLLIKHLILSGLVGAALSAYFWMPALFEKQYTIVDSLLLVNLANYKIHFVYPQQLWNWQWGFGGSSAGLADGISFKIGKLHIIIAMLAVIIAFLGKYLTHPKSKVNSKTDNLVIIFFFLFIFSAFMATFYSKVIWEAIPPLAYLQFPWRFLTFTALFSSILAGAFVYYLKLPVVKIASGFFLIVLLLIPNLKLFQPQFYRNDLTDAQATSKEVINWDVSLSSFEYAPKGVELYRNDLGTNQIKIAKFQIPTQQIEPISGNPQITLQKTTPTQNQFQVDSPTASKIRTNIFNFPGWHLKIDGGQAIIDDNNTLKLITFNVPKGNHSVRIEFGNTPVRLLANFISLLGIAYLFIIAIKKWKTLNIH